MSISEYQKEYKQGRVFSAIESSLKFLIDIDFKGFKLKFFRVKKYYVQLWTVDKQDFEGQFSAYAIFPAGILLDVKFLSKKKLIRKLDKYKLELKKPPR